MLEGVIWSERIVALLQDCFATGDFSKNPQCENARLICFKILAQNAREGCSISQGI